MRKIHLHVASTLFVCGIFQVSTAIGASGSNCPLGPNFCPSGSLIQCTSALTAGPGVQRQGFVCPGGASMQFSLYACYLPDGDQKKGEFYDKCQGIKSGLNLDAVVKVGTAYFNYSAPTQQKFQVIYCCQYES